MTNRSAVSLAFKQRKLACSDVKGCGPKRDFVSEVSNTKYSESIAASVFSNFLKRNFFPSNPAKFIIKLFFTTNRRNSKFIRYAEFLIIYDTVLQYFIRYTENSPSEIKYCRKTTAHHFNTTQRLTKSSTLELQIIFSLSITIDRQS